MTAARLLMLILAACLLTLPAGRAEAALSDHLTHQITEAQRLELLKQMDREIDALKQSAEGNPERAAQLRDILKQRAVLMERAGKYRQAEADLTQAVAVKPVDPALFADRGYFYMRVGRYPDALGDFVTGTRLEPNNAIFSFGAGRVLANLHDFATAIDLYNRAIELDPTHARRFLARAEALKSLGRYAEAGADYQEALRLGLGADDRFVALIGRGYASIGLGQYEQAVADLDEALKVNPSSSRALMWRGVANEKRGSAALALIDYERAARHDPDNGWLRASVRRLRSR